MADQEPLASPPSGGLESTAVLIEQIRNGDALARDRLFSRYLSLLQRWAHGRLPPTARGMSETDDLVQVTLIRALNRLDTFEPRREGAFLAYLRQILLNAVREEIRRAKRRPSGEPIRADFPGNARSVVEEVVGREALERYERALGELGEEHREAVILRLACGLDWNAIAEAIGSPSPNAARMLVARAIAHLAAVMHDGKDPA
jgi:RNA polymerase sigma factor (sigma-70 family)